MGNGLEHNQENIEKKRICKKKKSVKTFAMERWVFGGEKQIDKT